jgi:predicted metal-dependent HD superfamily phosphohydrolase
MDMAILGEDRDAYRAYAVGVRREFAAFPDPVFAVGRAQFLESQLARLRLFHTDIYQSERGGAARANMAWELQELRAGRISAG